MLLTELVTPTTVVKAARFILALELSAMQETHYPDLNAARYWLQDSLSHYLQPRIEPSLNGFSQIEYLEYLLKTLLEAVKSLLPCLKEETQWQLQQILSSEKTRQSEKQYA